MGGLKLTVGHQQIKYHGIVDLEYNEIYLRAWPSIPHIPRRPFVYLSPRLCAWMCMLTFGKRILAAQR